MVAPLRLRDFLIVSTSFTLVMLLFYFSRQSHVFWFLAFVPVFLAGWVWHRAGAVTVGVMTLTTTAIFVYMQALPGEVSITRTTLSLQIAIGFALIIAGGLGVGKISEVADLEKEIIRQTTLKDKSTDLFSENYLMLRLEDEAKRSERFDLPFSLMLIDPDGLHEFKETFGRFKTELLLRKMARFIERCLREVDIAARKGDSFAVILPGVRGEDAKAVAERARRAIEEAQFEGDEVEPHVLKTVSVGIAEFSVDGFDGKELIGSAREALESARKEGGNRVVLHSRHQ